MAIKETSISPTDVDTAIGQIVEAVPVNDMDPEVLAVAFLCMAINIINPAIQDDALLEAIGNTSNYICLLSQSEPEAKETIQ